MSIRRDPESKGGQFSQLTSMKKKLKLVLQILPLYTLVNWRRLIFASMLNIQFFLNNLQKRGTYALVKDGSKYSYYELKSQLQRISVVMYHYNLFKCFFIYRKYYFLKFFFLIFWHIFVSSYQTLFGRYQHHNDNYSISFK